MIVQISRIVFIATGALSGLAVSRLIDWTEQTGFPEYFVIFIFIILGSLIGYVFGGIIGRELTRLFGRAEERLADTVPTDLILGALGLIGGLIVGLLVSVPLRLVEPRWLSFVAESAVLAVMALLGVRVALVKRENVARAFPRLNTAGHAQTPAGVPPKYLDTSAVIDGRFVELARGGFLEGSLRVPRFVLAELQTLADSGDDARRARGRRGLDLLETLGGQDVEIEVFEADYPDLSDVDDKLMRVAEDTSGAILTVDYNLSKVARVKGVTVLNLHELATAMRPAFLPGEVIRLHVVKPGKEDDQGVGYLDDGTMVVVQGGRERIGEEIDTEVTSVLQTSAGRMIFTKARLP